MLSRVIFCGAALAGSSSSVMGVVFTSSSWSSAGGSECNHKWDCKTKERPFCVNLQCCPTVEPCTGPSPAPPAPSPAPPAPSPAPSGGQTCNHKSDCPENFQCVDLKCKRNPGPAPGPAPGSSTTTTTTSQNKPQPSGGKSLSELGMFMCYTPHPADLDKCLTPDLPVPNNETVSKQGIFLSAQNLASNKRPDKFCQWDATGEWVYGFGRDYWEKVATFANSGKPVWNLVNMDPMYPTGPIQLDSTVTWSSIQECMQSIEKDFKFTFSGVMVDTQHMNSERCKDNFGDLWKVGYPTASTVGNITCDQWLSWKIPTGHQFVGMCYDGPDIDACTTGELPNQYTKHQSGINISALLFNTEQWNGTAKKPADFAAARTELVKEGKKYSVYLP